MRNISRTLTVALLVSLICGCSNEHSLVGIPSPNATGADPDAQWFEGNPQAEGPQAAPIYSGTLPIGVTVDILLIDRRTDSSIILFQYRSNDDAPVERRLAIPLNMLGVRLHNRDGQPLFGYDFSLQSENCVIQAVWTPQDHIDVTYTRNGPAVTLGLNLNGDTHAIEFASEEEAELAVWLYTEYGQSPTRDLSLYEEGLLQRYTEMMEFLGDGGSFKENMDAIVTEQLMLDSAFLPRLIGSGEVGMTPTLAGCGLIGDIAAVLSLSCFLPPGPWTVVCIPAAGVSLACGLAGILSAIFD